MIEESPAKEDRDRLHRVVQIVTGKGKGRGKGRENPRQETARQSNRGPSPNTTTDREIESGNEIETGTEIVIVIVTERGIETGTAAATADAGTHVHLSEIRGRRSARGIEAGSFWTREALTGQNVVALTIRLHLASVAKVEVLHHHAATTRSRGVLHRAAHRVQKEDH